MSQDPATGAGPTSLDDPRLLPVTVAALTTTSSAASEHASVVVALPRIAADLGDASRLPRVVTDFPLPSAIAADAAAALLAAAPGSMVNLSSFPGSD